jgi:hypothetical protein
MAVPPRRTASAAGTARSGGVQQRDGSLVVGRARRREHVHQLVVVGTGTAVVGVVHAAPLVPREHLDLVQRGQVAHGVAPDLADAPGLGHPGHAERGRVGVAVPARQPRLSAGQEVAGGQVGGGGDEVEAEHLGVDPRPPPLRLLVFDDPVVDEPVGHEVSGEPAAGPGGDPPVA